MERNNRPCRLRSAIVVVLVWCVVLVAGSGMIDAPERDLHWLKKLAATGSTLRERQKEREIISESRVLQETEIGTTDRKIWVVTTASLPWMTGTSINPLLRAAFLTQDRHPGDVTLMLPFLRDMEDQKSVFPAGVTFATPEDQELAVKDWLRKAGLGKHADRLKLVFYPGRYHKDYGSIFPMGDITKLIPKEEADVCILEEPEHLNWYRAPGEAWSSLFTHVIGVVHTNYLAYSSGYSIWAPILTTLLRGMNKWVSRGHTHRLIKLSPVIQPLAEEKETVCNVHGVRNDFLEIGDKVVPSELSGAYFIGKSLWAKGYSQLMTLLDAKGHTIHMDVFGSGPDREAIIKRAEKLRLPLKFHPATDHAGLTKYKVFVNPSVSEVLCTTIAEALAMGKWVVCANHPSNQFFYQFPSCLPFETAEQFASNIAYALKHDAPVLTHELRHQLSWESANQRLLACSTVTLGEHKKRKHRVDSMCRGSHSVLSRGMFGDLFRVLCGAKSAAWQVKFMKQEKEGAGATNKHGDLVIVQAP